jgi:RsiW-degrading membrane proteinase PrsW (M82 family)
MGTDSTGRHASGTGAGGRWRSLLLGLAAVAAFPVVFLLLRLAMPLLGGRDAFWGTSPATVAVAVSIAVGGVGLVYGLRALTHHERSWRVWSGTLLSGLVACGWIAFALAQGISPT